MVTLRRRYARGTDFWDFYFVCCGRRRSSTHGVKKKNFWDFSLFVLAGDEADHWRCIGQASAALQRYMYVCHYMYPPHMTCILLLIWHVSSTTAVYVCMSLHVSSSTCRMRRRIHVVSCICMYTNIRMCACMYTYVHTHTHAYRHTHAHTHTHTHTHTQPCSSRRRSAAHRTWTSTTSVTSCFRQNKKVGAPACSPM